MLCDNCKKNNANFHYKHNENGVVTEVHLCSECAKSNNKFNQLFHDKEKIFDNSAFLDNFMDIGSYISILSEGSIGSGYISSSKVCPSCGMSEYELKKNGKIGCRECYNTFSNTIEAMLKKLHISTSYKGKIPDGIGESLSTARKIEKLRNDLGAAVSAQEYEEAAKIRDAIKQLENAEDIHNERNDI